MTGRIRAILIEILDITNDVRYVVRLRITFRVGNSLYKCEVRMGRPFAAADGAGFVTRSPLNAFEPSFLPMFRLVRRVFFEVPPGEDPRTSLCCDDEVQLRVQIGEI